MTRVRLVSSGDHPMIVARAGLGPKRPDLPIVMPPRFRSILPVVLFWLLTLGAGCTRRPDPLLSSVFASRHHVIATENTPRAAAFGGDSFWVVGQDGSVRGGAAEPGNGAALAALPPVINAFSGPAGGYLLMANGLVQLTSDGRRINLPRLPADYLASGGAANRAAVVVIAKDQAGNSFHLLRLQPPTAGGTWHDIGAVPAGLSTISAVALQTAGERQQVYVFGGDTEGRPAAAALELISRQWKRISLPADAGVPMHATPVGITHLLVFFSGAPKRPPTALRAYDTTTAAWTASLPWTYGTPLASHATGGEITVLSRDGTTTGLTELTYTQRARGLTPADYAVLGIFLLCLIAISWKHSGRTRSSDGYFRGGRRIPWFAAGLSVVATRLSATSFISIPAKSFATNWQYALVPVTNIVGAFLMTRYFVRFFVRLNVTSGYEYLEKRFGPAVRTIGSLNYLLYELSRIGILILVPAVALYAVAKLDLSATIIVIGAVVTAYTVIGGIEGVVWSDVFQMSIKVVGLLVATVVVFADLRGSPVALAGDAWRMGKLNVLDLHWDFTRDTLWVYLLFWLTDGLKSYVANQTIIQRFISTKDERAARRTVWSSALVGTGVSWLLLLLGTGLFLYFRQHPAALDLTMDKPDAVFPWFIVFGLPPGLTGLLVAALMASAMSGLAGAMNSTSTVMVTDFYRRVRPSAPDRSALRLGKLLTCVVGCFATGIALYLSRLSARSLFDQTLMVVGLFGGGLGGMFLLGMLTTRVGSAAVLVGLLASAVVQFYVGTQTHLHLLLYMFTGMASCMAVGWLASFAWPERKALDGLTIHTTAR